MSALRGPLGLILAAVVMIVIFMAAHDSVRTMERQAAAREVERDAVIQKARELTSLSVAVKALNASTTPTEPASPVVERIAASEGVTVISTQSAGATAVGPYSEARTIIRLGAAPLGPLKRVLARVEAAQPGMLIRELTVRRSAIRPDQLDAELVLGQLTPSALR